MKKIALILSILCMAAIGSWSGNNSPQIPIQVLQAGQETGINDRGLANVPICAYYEEFLSSVCLTFSQNLGDLDITITNLTDGTYADYEVDSSLGSAILPMSGNTGIYNVLIVTAGGIQYGGEFEVD